MAKSETKREIRKPYLWEALLSFGFLIFIIAISVLVFHVDLHLPMMLAALVAAAIAKRCGFTWKDIEKSFLDGIYVAMPAVLILVVVGALIGVWLMAGVVPTMIYYGLAILNPQFFLITALIIASMTSLITGTSWGTAGTIGIAFMGIASGLGISPAIAAGAIVSGAYFGDKISPLSDTTNMAASVAGCDLFAHIKCMFNQTWIGYAFALIGFLVIGFFLTPATDGASAEYLRQGLQDNFNISPILLIPPVAVIVAIALKVPALPGIFIGLVAGAIFGVIFQGNGFGDIMVFGLEGFSVETGVAQIDNLLSRGGIENNMFAVSLIIIAMSFGGVMEKSGQLEVVVDRIIKIFVRGNTSLVATTVGTTLLSNVAMAEQYVAVIVPTKMFATSYRKRGLHPKMLAGAVDGTGTLTSAIVPWNTCGIAMASFLGISAWQFAPYALFNWSAPIIIIGLAAIGKFTYKIKDDESSLTTAYIETYKNQPLPKDV